MSLFLFSTLMAARLPKTGEESVRQETIGPAMQPFTEKTKKHDADKTSKDEAQPNQEEKTTHSTPHSTTGHPPPHSTWEKYKHQLDQQRAHSHPSRTNQE